MNDFVENQWIVPGNISDYDHVAAFESQKVITWGLKLKNIKVNDIVYIYSATPYSEIRYKCVVEKVDIADDERFGDEFWVYPFVHDPDLRYINLRLVDEFNGDFRLRLHYLKENKYINNPPQSPGRIRKNLSELLKSI